ncbi:50S ribosomal protein L21 [Sneathiella sp.]|uniref:50S ribosomal protein L21 n=1 Tax=Sneathiella sp. TaxID=1964365 RepID=UPI0035677B32
MFAVIKTGGKQYRVAKNDVIKVERLTGEAGDDVQLDQVLAITGDDGALSIGAPLLEGAFVSATLLEQARADKIVVFKKKRRQNYRRKAGHRQNLSVLRITDISAKGAKKAAEPKAKAASKPVKADTAEKVEKPDTAPKKAAPKKAAAPKAAAKKETPKKAAPKKAAAKKTEE